LGAPGRVSQPPTGPEGFRPRLEPRQRTRAGRGDRTGVAARRHRAQIRTTRRLVELYATTDAGTKRTVRSAAAQVRGIGDLLLGIAKWYAADARGASATTECALAVEAISLENCASDFRDTLRAMGVTWLAFERNGLDPRAAFLRAAAGADRDPPRGGRTPVAEMLTAFETSAYLAALRPRRARGAMRKPGPGAEVEPFRRDPR
jgi:hypothetical protein